MPLYSRSPDLTCLDFYLWGRVKELVVANRPTTKQDMIQRIRNTIRQIPMAEVEIAVFATRGRLELCINQDGRQFEHLGHH